MANAAHQIERLSRGHLTDGPLRLNLGCRTTRIDGFLNVDLYEGDNVDVKSDVSKLPFDEGSVGVIYASHILEHFSHTKTLAVLREWRRVLTPDGKLYVAVPDFDAMVKLYLKVGLSLFVRNTLYGDQGYELAYHYTAFTFATLAAACVDAGFRDVRRIGKMPYGIKDCSGNRDSLTFQPVSLNVEAFA